MDQITINRTTENTIEFDMKIDGASINDADVRFVIELESFSITVPCNNTNQNEFAVEVPVLSFIEPGTYDCHIEVVINGQIFKPLRTEVDVVNNVNVTASLPNTSINTVRGEEGEEISAPHVSSSSPSSLLSILQQRNAAEEGVQPSVGEKDQQVKAILESLNITPKPKKSTTSLAGIARKRRSAKKVD